MTQMYNVFVNNNLLSIAKSSKNNFEQECEFKDSKQLLKYIKQLEDDNFKSVLILSKKPTKVFKELMKLMETRIAAGGLVKNQKEEVLFIFRKGLWDLPKGHLDKGETLEKCAKREVKEETGIKKLKIKQDLGQTYHIYRTKKKQILKISHWFEMYSEFDGVFKPQIEEDITEATWIPKEKIEDVLSNSWSNIKLLFKV